MELEVSVVLSTEEDLSDRPIHSDLYSLRMQLVPSLSLVELVVMLVSVELVELVVMQLSDEPEVLVVLDEPVESPMLVVLSDKIHDL